LQGIITILRFKNKRRSTAMLFKQATIFDKQLDAATKYYLKAAFDDVSAALILYHFLSVNDLKNNQELLDYLTKNFLNKQGKNASIELKPNSSLNEIAEKARKLYDILGLDIIVYLVDRLKNSDLDGQALLQFLLN